MSKKIGIDRLFKQLRPLAPMGYAAGLHIRFAAPLVSDFTYPADWLKHYSSNAYMLRDPILAWGLSHVDAKRWSEKELNDPLGIMAQAAGYGLKYGMTVSCGPLTSRTIVGAARGDREFTDDEIAAIQRIVYELHDLAEPDGQLTQAQVEALKCIADGNRHAAAADKLGISESALKARLTAARNRLLARTTSEAIQKAKEQRLL
jgi:LuxR family transcriptional regulator